MKDICQMSRLNHCTVAFSGGAESATRLRAQGRYEQVVVPGENVRVFGFLGNEKQRFL